MSAPEIKDKFKLILFIASHTIVITEMRDSSAFARVRGERILKRLKQKYVNKIKRNIPILIYFCFDHFLQALNKYF